MARKQARFGQPAVYNASAPVLTDGDDSALNVDASGNLLVAGALTVSSISAITTSVTPGTAAANLGKAEDSAHSSGDTGVFDLAVANEAQTTLAGDGDYIGRATDTKGNTLAVGNVASGATDSGNPVKVGTKFNTTQPTFTDGQRADLQVNSRGELKVSITNSTTSATVSSSFADGSTNTIGALTIAAYGKIYNGTTWDRLYSANAISGTTGTGLLGAGQMVWDGTNWQKQKADTTGVPTVNAQLYPNSTALNTYAVHLTANGTTTPTAATAYVSSISISSEVAGTTSTVTIQDKQGTPLKLINGFSTTTLTTTPTVVNFQTPVKMTSGIDVVAAGAVAATLDVWINYYQ